MQENIDFSSFISLLTGKTLSNPESFGLNPRLLKLETHSLPLEISRLNPKIYENSSKENLQESLDKFLFGDLQKKERIFQLSGTSGSGKTTCLQLNYLKALRFWKKSDPIPLYLHSNWDSDLPERWSWLCRELGLDEQKFPLFSSPILLFLDEIDSILSMNKTFEMFREEFFEKDTHKCVISCGEDFEAGLFEKRSIAKRYMVPLEEKTCNFEEFVRKWFSEENNSDIESLIMVLNEKKIKPLIKNCQILHVILEILPSIKETEQLPLNLSRIYEIYTHKKVEKMRDSSYKDLLKQNDTEFLKFHLEKAKLFSAFLHQNNKNSLASYEKQAKDFLLDFEPYDMKNPLFSGFIRALDLNLLIKPPEHMILFFSHNDLKDFFLSKAIIEEVLSAKKALLSIRSIIDEEILMKFLVEMVKNDENLISNLKEIMYKSREESLLNSISATNAISILIAANIAFSGEDLSHINIMNANLRNGVFSDCDFTSANLTGSNLTNCKLNKAIFKDTHMKNIDFEVFPDLQIMANSCAFSDDGKEILTGCDDHSVKLWDLNGGLKRMLGGFDGISAFLPDNSGILAVTRNLMLLLDTFKGEIIRKFDGHKKFITAFTFSKDCSIIASVSEDVTIKLWEKATGRMISSFPSPDSCSVNFMTFSSNGQSLIFGANHSIQIMDISNGNIVNRFVFIDSSSIAFSSDLILTGLGGMICLWDQTTGKTVKEFTDFGHSHIVNSVAFSPDEKLVVSGSDGSDAKSIILWDAKTGKLVKFFQGHGDKVVSLCFSTDGKNIVSGSLDKTVKYWNISTGLLIKSFEFGPTLKCVSFSKDGKIIMAGGSMIKLWNRATGDLIKTFEGHTSHVSCVGFSPDGKHILSSSLDKTMKLWDRQNGDLLKTINVKKWVLSFNFSNDGVNLLTCAANDKSFDLWDITQEKTIRTYEGLTKDVHFAIFSPDGNSIISAAYDKTIQIWEKTSGNLRKTLEGHVNLVLCIAISSDGTQMVSGGQDNQIILWDFFEGKLLKIIQAEQTIISIAFSPDSSIFLTGDTDGKIKFWEVSSGNLLKIQENNLAKSIVFSPDGETIMSRSDTCIKLWKIAKNGMEKCQENAVFVKCLVFSSDGKYLLTASTDKIIRLWEKSSLIRIFQGHTEQITSIIFSNDGAAIISGSLDKTIKLWEISTGKLLNSFENNEYAAWSIANFGDNILVGFLDKSIKSFSKSNFQMLKSFDGHNYGVTCLAFPPNGNDTFLSGSSDSTIKLWKSSGGYFVKSFEGHKDNVTSLAFSPNGDTFISGSEDKTIKLWEISTRSLVRSFEGHSAYVTSVGFLTKGTIIISGSLDRTIKLWDLASGVSIRTFDNIDPVECIAFSKDMKFIATGSKHSIRIWRYQAIKENDRRFIQSKDGKFIIDAEYQEKIIKLWEKSSGKLIRTFQGHQDRINFLAFSEDGTYVIGQSDDDVVNIWERTTGKLNKSITKADIRNTDNFVLEYSITSQETALYCKDSIILENDTLSESNLKLLIQNGAIQLENPQKIKNEPEIKPKDDKCVLF